MQRDPFTPVSLENYLDASDRYNEAVDRLVRLVGRGSNRFNEQSTLARELAHKLETARESLMQERARLQY